MLPQTNMFSYFPTTLNASSDCGQYTNISKHQNSCWICRVSDKSLSSNNNVKPWTDLAWWLVSCVVVLSASQHNTEVDSTRWWNEDRHVLHVYLWAAAVCVRSALVIICSSVTADDHYHTNGHWSRAITPQLWDTPEAVSGSCHPPHNDVWNGTTRRSYQCEPVQAVKETLDGNCCLVVSVYSLILHLSFASFIVTITFAFNFFIVVNYFYISETKSVAGSRLCFFIKSKLIKTLSILTF